MTYVDTFGEFYEGVQKIYIANPGAVRTRFSCKLSKPVSVSMG